DNRAHPHHSYWTHIPIYWVTIHAAFSVIFCTLFRPLINLAHIFFVAIYVHLALDTLVGGILWLYPASSKYIHFFDVPSIFNWWVMNFILHWTFLIELALVGIAIFVMIRTRISKG
ncbi:MAG: metal-dependent hydrolase, partial [Pseudomonadota bacterium]